jgi:DNA/RNA non-specific endonuclease.
LKKLLLLLLPLLIGGCAANTNDQNQQSNTQTKVDSAVSAEKLSQWTYSSGDKPVKILNDDKPSTIKASDFKSEHIDYGGLDKLNRTKTATAYLTRNNLGRSNTRTEQTWRPTGWNNQPKYVKGQRIIPQNRGHLIAYTMTFNLNKSGQVQQGQLGSIDNPYNLFTQTSFSNQKTMVQVEQIVRNSLTRNKKSHLSCNTSLSW